MKVLSIISFIALIFFTSCSKSNEEDLTKPDEDLSAKVFMRVKNTSLVDFKDVQVTPILKTNVKYGPVEAGKTTDYLSFKSVNDPFDVLITINENIGTGLLFPVLPEPKLLEPGKYTVELYIPNRGEIKPDIKIIKD